MRIQADALTNMKERRVLRPLRSIGSVWHPDGCNGRQPVTTT